ncbi:MAG: hypothetical protein JRJ47_10000 [Deltaproteobacteria bacterium]|nr:hypothetical protein [Deltaproteobacteria bacterium]
MRKAKVGVIFLVASTLAMLALAGGVAYAQQAPDHHKCYAVTPWQLPIPRVVVLEDQFGTVQGSVEHLRMFSPPVRKELPGGDNSWIINPEDHLTWYDFIGEPGEERRLLVTNQFGPDQEWTIGDPRFLLLPAWKVDVWPPLPPVDHPTDLDHYLCYDALSGPPVGLDGVTLWDQFTDMLPPEPVTVHEPVLFCNPVQKTVVEPPGETYPIFDPENHLACYRIEPQIPPSIPFEVLANDQFGDSFFMILDSQYLCVPSLKCPDMDGDGYFDINCGGDDCDDTNANIYPTNANANCDCVDPIPEGTEESETAGNCADGVDNDCDALVDTDPECTGGTCTGSAEASTYEASPVYGSSDLSKHLAYFFLPAGALIAIRIWRRKK